jgi:hypothetical protein
VLLPKAKDLANAEAENAAAAMPTSCSIRTNPNTPNPITPKVDISALKKKLGIKSFES